MQIIQRSVIQTFEQVKLVEMEVQIFKHKATLSPEQIAANEKKSLKPEPGSMPPMQYQTITKESLSQIPYMMRPAALGDEGGSVVNEFKDPNQRVVI